MMEPETKRVEKQTSIKRPRNKKKLLQQKTLEVSVPLQSMGSTEKIEILQAKTKSHPKPIIKSPSI